MTEDELSEGVRRYIRRFKRWRKKRHYTKGRRLLRRGVAYRSKGKSLRGKIYLLRGRRRLKKAGLRRMTVTRMHRRKHRFGR